MAATFLIVCLEFFSRTIFKHYMQTIKLLKAATGIFS